MTRVIGYHIWNGIIANSDEEICTEPPYLDFLLRDKQDAIKIMYYLAQNISALAKMCKMNEKEVRLLHESSQKKCYMPPYKMRYVKDRFLNLQKGYYKGAAYTYFYDAHQYTDLPAGDDVSVESCIIKAKAAQAVGKTVFETLSSLGMKTTRLISPVRALEDTTLVKMDLPGIDDIPETAGYYAYEGCVGNWLEAFKIGHWNMVWDYDINSAYPAVLAQQMDLRFGKWIESKEYVPEARYAECEGEVCIKSEFSPVIFRAGERNNLPLNYTTTGIWETHLNKRLIDFLKTYNIGSFEIKNGFWWVPDKIEYPLKSLIEWLFIEKEKASGLSKAIIKRMPAGLYGKLLEARNDSFGKFFNPVWAEDVETATRVEVAEFVLRNKIAPIHIAVDGVISPTPILLGERGLGKWELNNISPCICSGTGAVALNGNGNGNDFSLTYDKVRELIEENPEEQIYKLSKLSPVSIAEALNGKWDKLGELQEIHKYIGIGQEEKRAYREKPKNGGELLSGQFSSSPWDASFVRNPTTLY